MHTTHCICHTIGSRASSHIIWVQCTTCTTTRSNREILLASVNTFLLISTCNRMLETSRVGGVTSNGNINAFLPHNCNAFCYIICAIAIYLCTRAFRILRIALPEYFLYFASVIIHFGFYISKAVYSCNDLRSIFSKTIQNNTKRFLPNLICLFCNSDCAFSSGKRFVTCKKCETFCFFFQQHFAKVTMSKTNLTLIGNRTWNTECLQTFANCSSSVSCPLTSLFNCNCSAYCIGPFCIFKANRLNAFYHFIYIQTSSLCYFSGFFNRIDAIFF